MKAEPMPNEHPNSEQTSLQASKDIAEAGLYDHRTHSQEKILAALALLLGPETDYDMRVRATRRLARQGPQLLPLLLTTLNNYPEITSPPWPCWPPQYEHCSRLLVHLCQKAQIELEALLQHQVVSQPVGPVLWTSIIEAAGLLPHAGYETLLSKGLTAPWKTTRYAAAMALANLGGKGSLLDTTLETLRACQHEEEPIFIRLAASYALLRCRDTNSVEVLMKLIDSDAPEEARKAATFILATEPPRHICSLQRERLIGLLITTLEDCNGEISQHAACALSSIALPSTLPSLCRLLASSQPQVQVAALVALEEIASQGTMRRVLQKHTLLTPVVALLRSDVPEVRRQASYTLAASGGEYVTAVLGTTLLNENHPAHIEAIEGLRLLRGVLRRPTRTKVVGWLLRALRQPREEVQVTALDSLAYLAWQARTRGQKKAYADISHEILEDAVSLQLLACPHAWVRQRAIELLSILIDQPHTLHAQLIYLLHSDSDSGVRACAAYFLGQIAARWAIPDLIQALLDSDKYVAQTALNSLGQLASPDDAVVVYILKELAGGSSTKELYLTQSAQTLLKKWRKANREV
jgi:HEAT repeat protein